MLIPSTYSFYTCLFCFLLFLSAESSAQIVINEVCYRNATIIMDEEEDYEDWIELYNAGTEAINLKNYSLADRRDRLRNWRFPELMIPAKGYVLVYASGKNKTLLFDHWEMLIQEPDIWKYRIATAQLSTKWMEKDFNDEAWQEGKSGFGYGDGDDNTEVNVRYSLCLRKEFQIANKGNVAQLALHLDYDDAFVAWLNGEEVVRSNIGLANNPIEPREAPYSFVEAEIYRGVKPPQHFIIPTDLLKEGSNTLAIQVFNSDPGSSDFSARPFLSVAQKKATQQTKASFPDWYDLVLPQLHTDFKLKEGDTIYLLNNRRKLEDYLVLKPNQLDHSQGRFPDGQKQAPQRFEQATPGTSNTSATPYPTYADTIFSSLKPGFYAGAEVLRLSTKKEGATIRYTTDGSMPTAQSPIYERSIVVSKTMVIRAKAFRSNYLAGPTYDATYIIGRQHQLPIVSLVTNPEKLWDEEFGIYVTGNKADSLHPHYGANYWEDWEVPTQFTYLDRNGQVQVNQLVGIKIHGGGSRSQEMKSLRVIARSKYGKGRLKYPFFSEHHRKSFKQLILRNAGQGCNDDHLRDGFLHKLLREPTNLDTQGYEPCVVYINGEYWGIHNMREKINEYTVAAHYDLNRDQINMLGGAGDIEIAGSTTTYNELRHLLFNEDWQENERLHKSLLEQIDLYSCLDYFIVNLYTANRDWRRDSNVKFWQGDSTQPKWRYFLVDGDISLGFNANPDTNTLAEILSDDYYQYKVLQLLLDDPLIEQQFINRAADLLNTVFQPDHIRRELYELRDYLDTEMPYHTLRWKKTYGAWKDYFIEQSILGFTEKRADFLRLHFDEVFNCGWDVPIQLESNVSNGGTIKVNTLHINKFPWKGYYFTETPIQLTAIPNEGYVFKYWEIGGVKKETISVEVLPQSDLVCRAVFELQ